MMDYDIRRPWAFPGHLLSGRLEMHDSPQTFTRLRHPCHAGATPSPSPSLPYTPRQPPEAGDSHNSCLPPVWSARIMPNPCGTDKEKVAEDGRIMPVKAVWRGRPKTCTDMGWGRNTVADSCAPAARRERKRRIEPARANRAGMTSLESMFSPANPCPARGSSVSGEIQRELMKQLRLCERLTHGGSEGQSDKGPEARKDKAKGGRRPEHWNTGMLGQWAGGLGQQLRERHATSASVQNKAKHRKDRASRQNGAPRAGHGAVAGIRHGMPTAL
jgi:hypothetical protein